MPSNLSLVKGNTVQPPTKQIRVLNYIFAGGPPDRGGVISESFQLDMAKGDRLEEYSLPVKKGVGPTVFHRLIFESRGKCAVVVRGTWLWFEDFITNVPTTEAIPAPATEQLQAEQGVTP